MPAPTTFRGRTTQARRLQGMTQAYRASAGYQQRRVGAIAQRSIFARAGSPSATATTAAPATGCSNALVAAGVPCAQQAGLSRLGLSPAASLQQRQRLAAGAAMSRNGGASSGSYPSPPAFPAFPSPTYAPTYDPNAARAATFTSNVGARLASMRAQVQGYNRGGYPAAYAPTYPGAYTAGGYQTTGPDTTPAPPPPAVDPAQAQLPAPVTPQGPAPAADPRQALQVFQQSRTARGLPTVSGLEYLPSVDALAQQLLMTNDPDSRGALPYTLGHVYQVISEQAVRLGDLGLAQVYASLAARYPAPPAMAGFGAFQVGGVSLGGWALTAAVALGAAVGLLAVRDARRPSAPSSRSRPRRNGHRRAARR